jgi:hypothetical protein
MVNSLSKESQTEIQKLGQTLLTSYYAYDNLDIDLKHAVPTIEQETASATLIHLTLATNG